MCMHASLWRAGACGDVGTADVSWLASKLSMAMVAAHCHVGSTWRPECGRLTRHSDWAEEFGAGVSRFGCGVFGSTRQEDTLSGRRARQGDARHHQARTKGDGQQAACESSAASRTRATSVDLLGRVVVGRQLQSAIERAPPSLHAQRNAYTHSLVVHHSLASPRLITLSPPPLRQLARTAATLPLCTPAAALCSPFC